MNVFLATGREFRLHELLKKQAVVFVGVRRMLRCVIHF